MPKYTVAFTNRKGQRKRIPLKFSKSKATKLKNTVTKKTGFNDPKVVKVK